MAAVNLVLICFAFYRYLWWIMPHTLARMLFNMFTGVLWTYVKYLGGFFLLVIAFAYSFYMVFSPQFANQDGLSGHNVTNSLMGSNGTHVMYCVNNQGVQESTPGVAAFGGIGHSIVKTFVMFAGEMEYGDLHQSNPDFMAYVLVIAFVFLFIIVLMNILNGLAISDIGKILEEADIANKAWMVQSLNFYMPLVAERIVIGDLAHKKMSVAEDLRLMEEDLFWWLFKKIYYRHDVDGFTGQGDNERKESYHYHLTCPAAHGLLHLAHVKKEKVLV